MDEPKLTPEQEQELDETLKRASSLEETVNSKGWVYIKAYYQNQVQNFATQLLISEDLPIDKFEKARWELLGIKKLLAGIDGDLETLKNFREKQSKNEGQNGQDS